MMHDSFFFFFAFYLFYLISFSFFLFFLLSLFQLMVFPISKATLFVVCIFFLARTRWDGMWVRLDS